jgi:predicted RNase H-like HicB family nuclease
MALGDKINPALHPKSLRERTMKLKVFICTADEGGYGAKVPGIPRCVSQGESLEEACANVLDALDGCLAVREEMARQEAPAFEEREV